MRGYSVGWDLLNRIRLIIQMVAGLYQEIYYELWKHHYAQGAAIGLGLVAVTAFEIAWRWWRTWERERGAVVTDAPPRRG